MRSPVARQRPAVFRLPEEVYHADTCDLLRQAVARGDVTLVARARGSYPGERFPDRMLPEIRSVGYWDAECHQSWGLDWHRNEGIELTYVARGKTPFAVDDQRYLLTRGDLTVTRPWQAHRVGNPHIGACRLYWLILDVGVRRPNQPWCWPKWLSLAEPDLQTLTILLSHNEQPVWHGADAMGEQFARMTEAALDLQESWLRLAAGTLFLSLADLVQRRRPPLDRLLSSTQRTVELFLASLAGAAQVPWDLRSMAEACGLGRSRFSFYCRLLTGMSPVQYLTHCRMRLAGSLLLEQPTVSVTEVAARCGFETSQYFSTVFHAHYGCSPRIYRQRGLPLAGTARGLAPGRSSVGNSAG